MPAETVYRVRTVYSVEGTSKVRGDVEGATGAMGMFANAISRTSSLLGGLASMTAKLAMAGGVAAVGAITYGVAKLGAQAEDTKFSLAAMFQANRAAGADTFEKSFELAGAAMERIRKTAKALPGTTQDLMNIAQMAMSPGLQSGKSIGEVINFAGRLQATSKMLQAGSSEEVGHQLAMMLEGHANKRLALGRKLSPFIDGGIESLNSKTMPEKFQAIEKALSKFDPAVKAYATSWSAATTAASSNLKDVWKVATAPLFEMAKQNLLRMNEYWEKNEARIRATARVIGQDLVGGVRAAVGYARDLVGLLERAAASPVGQAVRGAMARASGAVGSVISGVRGAMDGSAAGGTASLGTMGMVIEAGRNLFRGAADVVLTFAHGTVERVEAIFKPLSDFGQSVMRDVLPFTQGVGDFLSGAAKFTSPLLSGLADLTGSLVRAVAAITGPFIGAILDATGYLLGLAGKGLKIAGESLHRDFGFGAPNNADKYLDVSPDALDAKERMRLSRVTRRGGGGMEVGDFGNLDQVLARANSLTRRGEMVMGDELAKRRADGMLDQKNVAKKPEVNIGSIHIHQSIENANDPDRVLVKTREAIDQSFYHPIESASNRFATVK